MKALMATAALGLLLTTGCLIPPGCTDRALVDVILAHDDSPLEVREQAYQQVRELCDRPKWQKPRGRRSIGRGVQCSSAVGYDGVSSTTCISF